MDMFQLVRRVAPTRLAPSPFTTKTLTFSSPAALPDQRIAARHGPALESGSRRTQEGEVTTAREDAVHPQHPTHPAPMAGASAAGASNYARVGRRHVLSMAMLGGAAAALAGPTPDAEALALGPLGPVKRVGGDKRTGLTAEEVAEVLRRDLAVGQYFVTGDLTREIFADDCRFVDPTNDVSGLSKYLTALGVLFDPEFSKVELLSISATGPRTVEADWRLGGYLDFPWNPRVEPFEGHTVYTLSDEGLVAVQAQTWGISGATALVESFTPTWGPRRQLF